MEGSVGFARKSSWELFSFQLLLDPVVLGPGGGHHLAAPHPWHPPLASRYKVLQKDSKQINISIARQIPGKYDRKYNSKIESRIAR